MRNLRLAVRHLLKSPGFAGAALLTLTLGIGANVALFSLLNTVILRPLAYPDAERLVRIWGAFADRGLDQANLSYPRYEFIRDQTEAFAGVAAQAYTAFTVTGQGEPEQVQASRVSANFFPLLGIQPLHGRGFLPDDDTEGGAPVVLVSHAYWRNRLGSDPAVVGRPLTLNNVPHTIIGVLPESLGFPFAGIQLWAARPFALEGLPRELMLRGSGYLTVHARLRPDVDLARANEQLRAVSARYSAVHPEKVDAQAGIFARRLHDDLVGDQRPTFLLLLAAVGAVLLIACANVANLFLVRLTSRRREIAIRAALGATRRELVWQFLTESVLVAALAGLLGALLAVWGVAGLAGYAGAFLPRVAELQVDANVLAFAVVLSLLTGLAMGLLPAWQASRTDVNDTLKEATRGNTGGRSAGRLRSALFVGEVALSLVLLIGAGLLLSSFARLQTTRTGLNPANLTTFNVQLPPARYPDPDRQLAFHAELIRRLAALPGVESASGVADLPVIAGGNTRSPFALEGQALPPMNERRLAVRTNTLPGYFATLGIPLRQGRDFDWRDRSDRPNVVILSEATARRLFPAGENPIGRRLITGLASIPREIVGVVGDVRAEGLATAAGDALYYPTAQTGDGFFSYVLRSTRPAAALKDDIRTTLRSLDPDIPLTEVRAFSTLVADSIADRRLVLQLVGAFAALALGLAGLGIYSVIAYSVAQRTAELGVRLALGASPAGIVHLVLREGLRLTALGLGLGLLAALGLTRLLRTQLYEVSAADPVVYGGVTLFLLTAATLACWLPARRASRIDPLTALRSD